MTLQNHPETQPLNAHGPVLGCWSLMPGTALSLLPREAGALRMASGRVWATVDGPHTGHGNESGDHFLVAGQTLAVRSGQQLVFESWNPVPGLPAYFDWTPLVADWAVPKTNWQAAVVSGPGVASSSHVRTTVSASGVFMFTSAETAALRVSSSRSFT